MKDFEKFINKFRSNLKLKEVVYDIYAIRDNNYDVVENQE